MLHRTILFRMTKLTMQGNAGDSRTVLGVKGRAKPLSFDHKPQNEGQPTRDATCNWSERVLTLYRRESKDMRRWWFRGLRPRQRQPRLVSRHWRL